jgi:hypothetical protein
VLALEPLRGLRVVADPAAVDAARWISEGASVTVLRIAADEALAVGAIGVELLDDHAIVEVEDGCVGAWLSSDALDRIASRTEWSVPKHRPALAQGLVAGVAAKLWLPDDGPALLVTAAAHAAELSSRLR